MFRDVRFRKPGRNESVGAGRAPGTVPAIGCRAMRRTGARFLKVYGMKKRMFLFSCCLLLAAAGLAQSTRVRGRVTDARTGEPVPLVSVSFVGTTIGITTDFDGMYALETRDSVRELSVSLLGYEPQTVAVVPGAFNALDFSLQPAEFALEEVVVTPGENPAHAILRRVSRHKHRNDPDRLPGYSCSTYTKMELDLANIRPYFKNKRLQRNFGFIFEHMDTSVATGKAYLPVMISESTADYYHRKNPPFSREVIRASRISGIEQDYSLAQFTGHLHADMNFYDNYLDLFNVKFAGPLSEHGLMYYNYFLVDSARIENRKTYKIRFHPKNLSTPVLDGEVNIDSATWALRSASVKMMKGLNVNWLRDLTMETENALVGDSLWFRKRDAMSADFSIVLSDSSKLLSFLGHRQVIYSDVRPGDSIPPGVLRMDNNIMVEEGVLKNDDAYWEEVRPYALSEKEKAVYAMVDSVKRVPLYRDIYSVVKMIFGGYYDTKYVGIGPYYKMFSFNRLEGARFQLGGRTTRDFSRKVRLTGYAAYGTKDNRFKGGGSVEYLFRQQPTRKLTAAFKRDALQLGSGISAFTQGNLLGSILSRGNKERLSMVNEGSLTYRHEWRQGIENTLEAQVRTVFPSKYVPLLRPDGTPAGSVQSASLRLGARFSKNETVVRQGFDVYRFRGDFPVFAVNLTAGLKGLFRDDYEYYRLEGSVQYDLNLPPLGTSELAVSGGKIFGKVPYPLLKLHEGNGTYFYDPYAFSCMDYYEFASDAWVSFLYEHHFKGFFLGKIPLLRRLKWREVAIFKGVYGTLEARNNGSLPATQAILLFPEGMSSVSKPYFEGGVGIENIFRIFRVDAIWRLSHRHPVPGQDIQNFAVNFSMNIQF